MSVDEKGEYTTCNTIAALCNAFDGRKGTKRALFLLAIRVLRSARSLPLMHILLIDRSQGPGPRRRVRAVLDAYALRTGDASWSTPITQEALNALRQALRRVASRRVSVGCYLNVGRARLRLAWVVGRGAEFEPSGATPVASTRRRQPPVMAGWLKRTALLAAAAGHVHDLGKASRMFQRKLRGGASQADAVRHEWLSLQVWRGLRRGRGWSEAWDLGGVQGQAMRELPAFMRRGVRDAKEAVDFLIASHHKLFGTEKGTSGLAPDHGLHIRQGLVCADVDLGPEGRIDARTLEAAVSAERRLARWDGADGAGWWPAALLARVALVFADHLVSSRTHTARTPDSGGGLYANTRSKDGRRRAPARPGPSVLNQPLAWHLDAVGELAAQAAVRMHQMRLEGLAPHTVAEILAPSGEESRFAWQDSTTQALQRWREALTGPALVLNTAATGTGKTRMNAKTVCALASGPVRFAIVLNLRSLTLQTGDALREQLKVSASEMAVVIGDPVVQQLHASAVRKTPSGTVDEDENPVVERFDVAGDRFEVPDWLEAWVETDGARRRLIGAPLLVSTVDALVAAGEPQKQQHHVTAMLRLLSGSDLVLDEIDGYDPEALVAVLRLVQMAALCGRHVIASSATLSYPVAGALHAAFRSGCVMRRRLKDETVPLGVDVALVNDLQPLLTLAPTDDFDTGYRRHVEAGMAHLDARDDRVARFGAVWPMLGNRPRSMTDHFRQSRADRARAWADRVGAAVQRMHESHGWGWPGSSKRVSFGLVRVARIRTAVLLAKRLAALAAGHATQDWRIACYHAQDFLIQRHLKEQRLDRLLQRGRGDDHLVADEEVRRLVEGSPRQHIVFLVIATPVEEVGRDHDFDWAVIEPSSAQSVVQTSGRVNRHRSLTRPLLDARATPNVFVLDLNFAAMVHGEVANHGPDRHWPRAVFSKPGLESDEALYRWEGQRAVSMGWLLGSSFVVDARLRFRGDRHPLAQLDDQSVAARIALPMRLLTSAGDAPAASLVAQGFYEKYPLRDRQPRQTLRVVERDGQWRLQRWDETLLGADWLDVPSPGVDFNTPAHPQAWMAWSPDELSQACMDRNLDPSLGLRVETRWMDDLRTLRWDPGWGWHPDESF